MVKRVTGVSGGESLVRQQESESQGSMGQDKVEIVMPGHWRGLRTENTESNLYV